MPSRGCVAGDPARCSAWRRAARRCRVYDELVRRAPTAGSASPGATASCSTSTWASPPGHPESYRSFIDRTFTGRVDFTAGAIHGPDGTAADVVAACRAYEDAIAAAGGVDLQLLGLGRDGHIGVQRARVVARLADAAQDADQPDRVRQRPVLRSGRRRPPPRRSPRAWGRSSTLATSCSSPRGRQGRAAGPGGRGAVDGDGPRLGPPAPPHVTVVVGRRGRRGADAGRLLPGGLGRQARWQGL